MQRNQYFDFLRGFAIIMVVGIHTLPAGIAWFDSVQESCAIVLRQILNCAVPLFLAISGFFMAPKKITGVRSHYEFLSRHIPGVYIPCLVFSLPYLAMSFISGESGILKSLTMFFACGFSVYYFIALIMQYYVLLPLLNKINNTSGMIVVSVISCVSILVVTYLMKVLGIEIHLLLYAGPFPLWILFFFMGLYLGTHSRDYGLLWPVVITVAGLTLQIAEFIYWGHRGVGAFGIKISSFIFSAGVILVCFSKKAETRYNGNIALSVINWIGGISFGIYLLHCYWIMIIHHFAPEMNWILKWTLVLSATILTIWIVKLVMPRTAKKYLGFR